MKTISHRELRNRSGEVLREVAGGETYEVTNRGEVVARLVPPDVAVELRCVRPAARRAVWSRRKRLHADEPTAVALDELRTDR